MKIRIDTFGGSLVLYGDFRVSWILEITPSGKLEIQTGVNNGTRLCLDEQGRIEEEK